MSGKNLKGLIALNGVLLALLTAVTFSSTATAQQRFRGSYAMVSGRSNGSPLTNVYIANQNSREIVAIRYNVQQKLLEGMGYADLAAAGGTIRQNRK